MLDTSVLDIYSVEHKAHQGISANSLFHVSRVCKRCIIMFTPPYMCIPDGAEGEEGDVSKAQEHLLHSFRSGASACLICIDNIKREDAVSQHFWMGDREDKVYSKPSQGSHWHQKTKHKKQNSKVRCSRFTQKGMVPGLEIELLWCTCCLRYPSYKRTVSTLKNKSFLHHATRYILSPVGVWVFNMSTSCIILCYTQCIHKWWASNTESRSQRSWAPLKVMTDSISDHGKMRNLDTASL